MTAHPYGNLSLLWIALTHGTAFHTLLVHQQRPWVFDSYYYLYNKSSVHTSLHQVQTVLGHGYEEYEHDSGPIVFSHHINMWKVAKLKWGNVNTRYMRCWNLRLLWTHRRLSKKHCKQVGQMRFSLSHFIFEIIILILPDSRMCAQGRWRLSTQINYSPGN